MVTEGSGSMHIQVGWWYSAHGFGTATKQHRCRDFLRRNGVNTFSALLISSCEAFAVISVTFDMFPTQQLASHVSQTYRKCRYCTRWDNLGRSGKGVRKQDMIRLRDMALTAGFIPMILFGQQGLCQCLRRTAGLMPMSFFHSIHINHWAGVPQLKVANLYVYI